MKNKGFSLVELIVVIAIMAILVGVAVPVYTSYISKAQKNKDIQMVDEIKHAIEIKLIAENATSCVGGVCVTTKGTSIIGCSAGDGSYELIMATLEETFGLDWDQMKLDYDGWAGGKTTAAALSNFGTWTGDLAGLVAEGEDLVAPSYVNEIEDMFSLIKDTATFVGGALDTGAASLVKDAASLTMSGSTSAEDFAKYYAGSEWDSSFLMGENADDYTEVGEEGYATDVLSSAIANAAVIKARNTAFANYLRINGVSETTCSKVENLSLGTSG
ncbi:MAG: prepilin-type N-terminal cleavage/methylation domain-containing protein, partial [Clostridia bacterium]|nr:prepilin-type N-terminal cleavage/methylation domain-containing protein [Clostridia bacterium]